MSLQGASELRSRLRAIKTVFKPAGRQWADETVRLARSRVTVRTGKTQKSIRRRNASQKKAAVVASFGARFLEAGTQPHDIKVKRFKALKYNVAGQPLFSKRVHHPSTAARPFLFRSASDALAKWPVLRDLIELWNKAA